jgi:hypothetical protein
MPEPKLYELYAFSTHIGVAVGLLKGAQGDQFAGIPAVAQSSLYSRKPSA